MLSQVDQRTLLSQSAVLPVRPAPPMVAMLQRETPSLAEHLSPLAEWAVVKIQAVARDSEVEAETLLLTAMDPMGPAETLTQPVAMAGMALEAEALVATAPL